MAKKKKTGLGKLWQTITENPFLATAIAGFGFGAAKDLYPDFYGDTMSFLNMDPITTNNPGAPIKGTRQTGVYGQPSKYTKSYNTTAARKSIFGTTQGLGYDLQKGIGQSLAILPQMGALFSSDGAAYNYLRGRGNLGQVRTGLQNTLPDFAKNTLFDGNWGKAYRAYRDKTRFGGGPPGSGGNQTIQARRSSRSGMGSLSAPSYSAGKISPYDPSRLSANLLRTSYKDEYLQFINKPAQSVRRMGANIDFRTKISVKKRKV